MEEAHRVAWLVLGSVVAMSFGCAGLRVHTSQQAPHLLPVDYRARTLTEFEQGVFFKPRDGSANGLSTDLAPLLVQQVIGGGASAGRDRFGAAMVDAQGRVRVDTTRATIYTGVSTVTFGARYHDQVVYLWWYPPAAGARSRPTADQRWGVFLADSGQARPRGSGIVTGPRGMGVRITMDADGFPCVWEVLGNEADVDLVFVSESFERAAAEAFGSPLPGRRYSVERGLSETPTTVVARVIDDGPIPMGPIVYLAAAGRAVTTVTCRCMPSQVSRFVETIYYDLQPIDLLDPRLLDRMGLGGFVMPAPRRRGSDSRAAAAGFDREPLERRLRLPATGTAGETKPS